jgi:hypothetical protein
VTAGAVVAVTAILFPSHATAAKAPAKAGDFNGDGKRDIALGMPEGLFGDEPGEGLVSVIYTGSKKRQVITVHSPGVSTVAEHGDGFGDTIASADFDRDGYSDLAVTGWEDDGVTLIYGSKKGLSTRVAYLVTEDERDNGGLAVGDFDKNGSPDLVATVGRNFWIFSNVGKGKVTAKAMTPPKRGDFDDVGNLSPVVGDFTGDGNTDLALVDGTSYDRRGIAFLKGSKTGLGKAAFLALPGGDQATAADLNGDGKTDLIASSSGKVRIYLGKADGLTKPLGFTQKTPGMPGADKNNAYSFGEALAAGDINQDGKADLVIGNPNGGKKKHGGTVTILFGNTKGISTKGGRLFSEDTKGVPGTALNGDRFGKALSLVDLTGDRKLDLVVGAPGENKNRGIIYVFKNTKNRIGVKGIKSYNPKSLNLSGTGFGGIL